MLKKYADSAVYLAGLLEESGLENVQIHFCNVYAISVEFMDQEIDGSFKPLFSVWKDNENGDLGFIGEFLSVQEVYDFVRVLAALEKLETLNADGAYNFMFQQDVKEILLRLSDIL